MLIRALLLVISLGSSGVVGAVEKDLPPPPAPKVSSVFPPGAARGAVTGVDLAGSNLEQVSSVVFTGRGVTAEVVSASRDKASLRVTIAADAEAGRRDFRLTTPRGSYVGVFLVGTLAERNEKEPNDDHRNPEALTLPATINGIVASEDWDHFRFRAEAGRRYTFDLVATRGSSRLDAELAILDARGNELEWNDDFTIFGDPYIAWTAPSAGDYVIRVGSLGGNNAATYRLHAGVLPSVTEVFPAGLSAGRTTTVTLRGENLETLKRAWIGDNAAAAEITRTSATEAQVRFQTPSDLAPGRYWLHLATAAGVELPVPMEMRVSHLPEITVNTAPASLQTATAIQGSSVINGDLRQPNEVHYFRFEAKAGETWILEPESMRIHYHADPAIAVLDDAGNVIASADDPGIDDRADEYQIDADLAVTAPKTGAYYIRMRDAMYRGGPGMIYRLTVRRAQPDFIVELREPVKSAWQSRETLVQARVRRRGWTTPVDVWLEDLPVGVQAEKQTAAPVNAVVKDTCGVDRTIDGSIVWIPVRVAADARPGNHSLRVKARGVMNGRTVEHGAIVRYENLAAGYTYGPMERQQADFTIVETPHQ